MYGMKIIGIAAEVVWDNLQKAAVSETRFLLILEIKFVQFILIDYISTCYFIISFCKYFMNANLHIQLYDIAIYQYKTPHLQFRS